MVRLAHLSDIHITSPTLEWRKRDWFTKRYTSWINHRWLARGKRFRRADEVLGTLVADLDRRGIDHIIFSGDATALGFEAEFRRAAELLQVDQRPGLAVPGNHDYCTPFAAFSGLFERYFEPWEKGTRVDGSMYPFAQRVGPVWLVGVNSARGNVFPWDATGRVGADQLDRLKRLLSQLDPGPRLLVTHFPACLSDGQPEKWSRGLRDLTQLAAIAAEGGVRLWLHGHRHEPYVVLHCPFTVFPTICSGSATQINHWSYFEYDVDDQALRATRRFFDPETAAFREGESFTVSFDPVV